MIRVARVFALLWLAVALVPVAFAAGDGLPSDVTVGDVTYPLAAVFIAMMSGRVRPVIRHEIVLVEDDGQLSRGELRVALERAVHAGRRQTDAARDEANPKAA